MIRQHFADQLRFHRRAAGFSQEELAERSGLSARAISDLERSVKQRPYPETVRMLAAALGLEGDALIAFRLAASGQNPAAIPEPDPPTILTTIPQPLTGLIGREDDLAALTHLLEPGSGPRLVTLIGPGGVGKTRLALHLAHAAGGNYRQGATFVDLASVAKPDQVLPVVALALGIREHPERTALDTVTRALRAEQRLMVLDNLEQVIEAAPEIGAVLEACPAVTVLATSRAPLRLAGEHEVPVSPLGLPEPSRPHPPATLLRYPAIRLFVERAQAQQPDFAVGPENATDVAAICQAVDGLPLALELAAVRMKVLPPADLVAHLGYRLAVLNRGSRNLPARHQSLRETIAWSYNLLTLDEQQVFRAFGVFVSGASLEAVADVLFAGDTMAAIEMISDLQDQSLLHRHDTPDGAARFQMLETIREFAVERLAASGEAVAVRQLHADHFLQMAEAGEQALRGPDQARWMHLLEADYGNLRAAMGWQVDQAGAESSQRMGSALWRFWVASGRLREGRALLDQALALDPARRSLVRGRALLRAGNLAIDLAQYRLAIDLFADCRGISQELADDYLRCGSLTGQGIALHVLGNLAEAVESHLEVLRVCRANAWMAGEALALLNLGRLQLDQGEYVAAHHSFERSLVLHLGEDDQSGAAWCHLSLGTLHLRRGDLAAAQDALLLSLGIMRSTENRGGVASATNELGVLAQATGAPEAIAYFLEALDIFEDVGERINAVIALERLTDSLLKADHAREALVVLHIANAWREAFLVARDPTQEAFVQGVRQRVLSALNPADITEARAQGATMGVDHAIDLVRARLGNDWITAW